MAEGNPLTNRLVLPKRLHLNRKANLVKKKVAQIEPALVHQMEARTSSLLLPQKGRLRKMARSNHRHQNGC